MWPSALNPHTHLPSLPLQRQQDRNRYKTCLCHAFAEAGACKWGEQCTYAHGIQELRVVGTEGATGAHGPWGWVGVSGVGEEQALTPASRNSARSACKQLRLRMILGEGGGAEASAGAASRGGPGQQGTRLAGEVSRIVLGSAVPPSFGL